MSMEKEQIHRHFDKIAVQYDHWKQRNWYYHDTLKRFFGACVGPEDSVIEYGCGTGDILASVQARRKVGLDLSAQMTRIAREKHPDIEFRQHDGEQVCPEPEQFDVAILADIIDHITDILKLYGSVNRALKRGGRMCISTINPLWDPIFKIAEKLGQKMPEGEHNFVPNRHLIGFLELRGFRLVKRGAAMLVPRRIPGISGFLNRYAPGLPLLNRLCVVQTLVAEKIEEWTPGADAEAEQSVSVVIPCYNEEGNIEACASRVPDMGRFTEIIVVDDGSADRTSETATALAQKDKRVKLVSYTPNHGKGYAVKQGFDSAQGDILMILDADMTVPPEELPLFFGAVAHGKADFANGTRMIYPMEQQAMRFLNLMGNHFFSVLLSWLLGQRISDTLCGTKALRRADYQRIPMGADKWGDFDLLFGAAENRLRIAEIPVHYKQRVAGESKMKPFMHCLTLLRVCFRGFLRLKLKIGTTGRSAQSRPPRSAHSESEPE